jgi:hypothetical protein
MAANPDYKCTACRKQTKRELLTVMKVSFLEIGMTPKTLKSRNILWLCPRCLVRHPLWNIPEYATPGHLTPEELEAMGVLNAFKKAGIQSGTEGQEAGDGDSLRDDRDAGGLREPVQT